MANFKIHFEKYCRGNEYYSGDYIEMIKQIDEIIRSLDQNHKEQEKYDRIISKYYKKRMINRLNYREIIEEVESEVESEVEREVESEVESDAESEIECEIVNEAESEAVSEAESEIKSEKNVQIKILINQNKKCPKCEKAFTRYESLKYHIDNNSCKEYAFYCKYCGKGFTTNLSMCRHITSVCKEKKDVDHKKDIMCESLIKQNKRKEAILEEKIKEINNNHKKELKEIEHNIKKHHDKKLKN